MKRSLVETKRLKNGRCSTQLANFIVHNAGLDGKLYQLWFLIRGLTYQNGICWMSQEHMGDIIGVNRWWAGQLLNRLAEMGFTYSTGKNVNGTLNICLCVPRALIERYERSQRKRKETTQTIANETARKQYRTAQLYLRRRYNQPQGNKREGWKKPITTPYPTKRSS